MAPPRKHRRILAAQLHGAQQRLAGLAPSADDTERAAQQQRIDTIRHEIAAHDELHGPPNEVDAQGLWGTNGRPRYRNDLQSSSPTLGDEQRGSTTGTVAPQA